MAASAILDFVKSENFIGSWDPEGRDASSCQISANILINTLQIYCTSLIFKNEGRPSLPSCSFSLNVFCPVLPGSPICTSKINLIKIVLEVSIEILQIFRFSGPRSWIFKILKFYWLTISGVLCEISWHSIQRAERERERERETVLWCWMAIRRVTVNGL